MPPLAAKKPPRRPRQQTIDIYNATYVEVYQIIPSRLDVQLFHPLLGYGS